MNPEIDLDDPSTWPLGLFTCHTPGCMNENIPIPLEVPVADPLQANVTCGPCGKPITDKVAA